MLPSRCGEPEACASTVTVTSSLAEPDMGLTWTQEGADATRHGPSARSTPSRVTPRSRHAMLLMLKASSRCSVMLPNCLQPGALRYFSTHPAGTSSTVLSK